jgi:hypothetical protein
MIIFIQSVQTYRQNTQNHAFHFLADDNYLNIRTVCSQTDYTTESSSLR